MLDYLQFCFVLQGIYLLHTAKMLLFYRLALSIFMIYI
jgi:hypothetical protein